MKATRRSDRGSVSIELVALFPVVIFFLLVVIQGAVAVHAVVVANDAAREGAREASRARFADGCARARQVAATAGHATCAQVRRPGDSVTVRVAVPVRSVLPFVDEFTVERDAVMPETGGL